MTVWLSDISPHKINDKPTGRETGRIRGSGNVYSLQSFRLAGPVQRQNMDGGGICCQDVQETERQSDS